MANHGDGEQPSTSIRWWESPLVALGILGLLSWAVVSASAPKADPCAKIIDCLDRGVPRDVCGDLFPDCKTEGPQ